jgi:serine protease Do
MELTVSRRRALAVFAACLNGPEVVKAAGLPDLITATKPSVCAVGMFNELESPRFAFRGSGFFVGDGSIVATCWHVVAGRPGATDKLGRSTLAIQLTGPDGELSIQEAELLRSDRAHDLALLKLRGAPGPSVGLDKSGTAQEGMAVALMGFPIGGALGFRHVTHRGIVASIVASSLPTGAARQLKGAAVSRLRSGSFELLQLDATAYPGNSGGPLFSIETGQVVGVVNMVLLKGNRESALSQPTGITYAIPVKYLTALLGSG